MRPTRIVELIVLLGTLAVLVAWLDGSGSFVVTPQPVHLARWITAALGG